MFHNSVGHYRSQVDKPLLAHPFEHFKLFSQERFLQNLRTAVLNLKIKIRNEENQNKKRIKMNKMRDDFTVKTNSFQQILQGT